MEVANKEAAKECLAKAQAAFRKGSFKEALRLAEKSSRMCRTEAADGENVKLNRPLAKPCQRQYNCGNYCLYVVSSYWVYLVVLAIGYRY